MSRKAGLVGEDSADVVADSSLRRSARICVNSAPQAAPVAAILRRTRRSSTSSVESVISVNSTASLPAATTRKTRARRPSLTIESKLEKNGDDGKKSKPGSPAMRTRRGSISSLQEDAMLTARAKSPTVAAKSDRHHSLRSASRSPTFDSKSTNESQASGTPRTIRDRRSSAEKAAPKRRASIALEVLNKELEPTGSSMRQVESKEKKLHVIAEVPEQETKKPHFKKGPLSSEAIVTKSDEGIRSRKSSESSLKTTSLDNAVPLATDLSSVALGRKIREQILAHPTVVLSPLKPKMSNETKEIVMAEHVQINEKSIDKIETLGMESGDLIMKTQSIEPNKSGTKTVLEMNILTEHSESPSVIPILEQIKISTQSSPKRTSFSQSPVRKSSRLHSETGSNNSESPSIKLEHYLISSKSSSPIIGKTSNIDSPEINTPIKQNKLEEKSSGIDESKEIVDGSDGSFHLSLKSLIMSSQESLNKSAADDMSKEIKENKLNIPNESDRETNAQVKTSPVKRISNVFSSKNIEESLESIDVEYPSGNDESFTVVKRVSMNKTDAQVVHTVSNESSSGSLHLMYSDNAEEEKIQGKALLDNRQSIAIIQLDKSSSIRSDFKGVVEVPTTTSLLDSSVSILPCKVLTALHTEAEQENNTIFAISLESSKSEEKKVISSIKQNLNNEISETGYVDLQKPTDLDDNHTFMFSDEEPEEELVLCIDIEKEDGSTNKEFVRSKKIQMSPSLNSTFAKCTQPNLNTPTKSEESNPNNVDEEKNLVATVNEGSDNEERSEKEPGIKFGNAALVHSQVSPGSDCFPNSDYKQQNIKVGLSNSSTRPSSDSEDEKQTNNKLKELQIITINSSSSSECGSDSELRKLISSKTAEYNEETDSSDTEFKPDQLLDDKATEGSDEDTPFEDMNEIDVGDNIEDTDDELEDEEVVSVSDEGNDAEYRNEGGQDYGGKEMVTKKKKRVNELGVEEVNLPILPVSKSKKKQNSSISVSENIRRDDVVKSDISDQIIDIVDLFCARISDKKGGRVNVNMSLDYDESSSNDESIKKPNVSLNISANKSLNRKSIERSVGECDSSMLTSATPSKIQVLQEIRLIGDAFPQQQEPQKPSKKSKKVGTHNTTPIKSIHDNDLFLPDSSNHNNSIGLRTTPKPTAACPQADNIISQLVDREVTTSKSNAKCGKKSSMPVPLKFTAEDYSRYSKPSISHGGTEQWRVFILKRQVKPSKNNLRKPENKI